MDPELTKLSEDERVQLWREEQFRLLGFTRQAAEALASARDVDVRYVEHLRSDLGYEPEQVVALVL